MSLVRFNRLNRLVPTFNTWIDNFYRDDDDFFADWNASRNFPPVNVEESEKEFQVSLAAPGLKKEDFNIEVKDNSLIISNESSEESEESEENYTRKEFSYRSFHRSFWLPENAKSDDIKASYKNGILMITVPKTKVEKGELSKKIKVG